MKIQITTKDIKKARICMKLSTPEVWYLEDAFQIQSSICALTFQVIWQGQTENDMFFEPS